MLEWAFKLKCRIESSKTKTLNFCKTKKVSPFVVSTQYLWVMRAIKNWYIKLGPLFDFLRTMVAITTKFDNRFHNLVAITAN